MEKSMSKPQYTPPSQQIILIIACTLLHEWSVLMEGFHSMGLTKFRRQLTYLAFDIWCYTKKQRDIEAQFDHVVPVLWRQQRLEEKKSKKKLLV